MLSEGLTFSLRFAILNSAWGIGAVGSAFEWHSKGHGFESHMLHLKNPLKQRVLFFSCHLGAPHSVQVLREFGFSALHDLHIQ